VKSAISDKAGVHEMKMDGNVMRMRELEKGLEIPPGATVELKPGGFHVMFMGLKAPLAKDQRVPITLVFEKAGSIDVDMKVEALGAQMPGHKS
jgi:copper(I)-binding protein